MNSVNLIGRITKDVELRTTTSGRSVAAFTIAVDRYGKNAGADFINCVAWERTAENMFSYVSKGDLVGVSGRLQQRQYEDNHGKKASVLEVVATEVKFLYTKRKEQEAAQAQNADFEEITDDETGLPF